METFAAALVAAMTGNRKDRELDIVLVSSKDGTVVRNLTRGFDKDLCTGIMQYPVTTIGAMANG